MLSRRRHRLPIRAARAGLALGVGLVLSAVLLEIALRTVLFRGDDLGPLWQSTLRRAGAFAAPSDDVYWKLQHLLADEARREPIPRADRVLGWTGRSVVPATYAHEEAARAEGKTPVLLYGDSFAMGTTSRYERFQAIMERSDLGESHALINYGVGGYGLDQIHLMLEQSIELWSAREPVVIVSVLVESDLERSLLTLRGWPKPRLRVEDGRLVGPDPVAGSVEEYLEAQPLRVTSYLLRYLSRRLLPERPQPSPTAGRASEHELVELNRHILAAVCRRLQQHEGRSFVLLFHNRDALDPDAASSWQETLIRTVCSEYGVPVISTRPFLLAASGGSIEGALDFYSRRRRDSGHLTGFGNRIAFEAIRQGLLGAFEPVDTSRLERMIADGVLVPAFEHATERRWLGHYARVYERDRARCVKMGPNELRLRVGRHGPTEVILDLENRATRLQARVRTDEARADVLLLVQTDGRAAARHRFVSTEWADLDVDLRGVREVAISLRNVGLRPLSAWIQLSELGLR